MSSIVSSTPSTTSSTSNIGQTALTDLGAQGTITSTGLGSGLDINSIVQQLVAAEGQGQKTLLTNQSTAIQTKISAYGQLAAAISGVQAALAALSTPQQFEGTLASVADTTIASATTDSSAAAGTYTLGVTQLATGAKLESAALGASTSVVGTGTLTVNVGSKSFNVVINSTNNTVAGIVGSINAAAAGTGVTASILTANDGAHIVLSSSTTGAANALSVSQTGGDGGLAGLAYDPNSTSTTQLAKLQQASDAIVTLDGNTYNSASNVVTGLLTGVTLNLSAPTASGATTTLTVSSDQSGAQQAVSTFVSSYNTLVQTVNSLSSYDSTSGTAGPLLGDALLNTFRNQLNETIDGSVKLPSGSPFNTLAGLGIVANADGTLSTNSTLLNNSFSNNFAAVAQLFSGTTGIATNLSSILNTYTQAGGVLATQNAALQQNLSSIADQTTALNQHLQSVQTTLLAQYNAMDVLVQQLKSTGTSLQSQLDAIYYPGKANTNL